VKEDKDSRPLGFPGEQLRPLCAALGMPPEHELARLDANPFVLGEFVWDRLRLSRRATPYNADVTNLLNFADPAEQARACRRTDGAGKIRVPSRSSLLRHHRPRGFPKDRYYLYQSRWRPGLPMAHLLPHWNWPERVGQVTPVFVYSSGDEAELFPERQITGPEETRAVRIPPSAGTKSSINLVS